MADPFITKEQLQDRLSEPVLRRIADDGGDGIPDQRVVDRLLRDACSKVRGGLGLILDVDLFTEVNATEAEELVRIALDTAVAYAAARFPEVMRRDWVPMMKQVDADLDRIRKGLANLGTNLAPEPAANQGGAIRSGDPREPTLVDYRFTYNWGDF